MTEIAGRSNHMDFNYLQRVKVYRLNDEGKWDDKGTGHVSVEYLEDSEPTGYGNAIGHTHSLAWWQSSESQRSDAVGLVVIDEEDNQTLLVHRISADDIYRRQEDTIISWTDPEVATDLALSFQETMGCSFIWDQICSVQRSIHFPSVGGLEGNARPVGDDLEHSGTSQDDGGGTEGLELPPVELSTLPQIAKTIGEVIPFDRDRVACMVARDQNYVGKLVQLFRTCEDLENVEGLRLMFKIVKGLISLNDGAIFDIIFSDEYIMDIVGALEYDSDLTTRQDHRTYLKEQVIFKEAVPIHDQTILSKIHQTYRIGYIKDVILPRVLDDQTFATINSIMLFNNVSVVSALQNDAAFLSELFSRLRSPETPEKNRRDLVFFVQEFCNLSKHLQPGVRSQLFGALAKEGLFDIVKDILKNAEESVRLSGCDILIVVLNNDPALLRSFLVHQPGHTLFSELVAGMLTHSEGGLQAQLLEIMRMLLDSETMDQPQVDKSMFLEIFYEKYMDQMVQVLIDGCPPEAGGAESPKDSPNNAGKPARQTVSPEILGNICELMCFCVQHHRFRIKYYVMRKHVVEKVLKLTRRKEKYLVVAAVRFLRTCISLKDEFYFRYIVKHNCFDPIIGAFMANGNRYNLLNSAVLELIDFIRKEGIKSLIVHLIEKYSTKLESIDYVETFKALRLKYEQMMEAPPVGTRDAGGAVASGGSDHGSRSIRDRPNHTGLSDSRKRKDDRALDKDEEDYFNEDSDDEEDTATARVRTSSSPQSANAVVLINKGRAHFGDIPFSDDVDDTATARVRTSSSRQSTKAVVLINKSSALVDVPFRGSRFGLVDYEDEEEDMPAALGINGKEGGSVFEAKSDSLLPVIPLTDPIWPEVEDVALVKRKMPLAPSLEQTDASALKRQKPEESRALVQSNKNAGSLDIDDLQRYCLPMTREEFVGLTDSTKKSSPVLASSGLAAAPEDSAKVYPCEDLKPASLPNNEPVTEQEGISPGRHPDSCPDPVIDGGAPWGNVEGAIAGSAGPSNGDMDMVPSEVPTPGSALRSSLTVLVMTEMLASSNGPEHVEAVTHSSGPLDVGNVHIGSNNSMREAGVNGDNNYTKIGDLDWKDAAPRVMSENGVGGCADEDCNRTLSERVDHEIVSSKGSSGNNNGLLQQHNASVGSEGNKLTSLGTDLMRGVTPTSPGHYTVQ